MKLQPIALVAALALAALPLAHATGTDHNGTTQQPVQAAAGDNPTGSAEGSTPRKPATARQKAGLKAAKKGTGASRGHAEQQEHMPVPKTGM